MSNFSIQIPQQLLWRQMICLKTNFVPDELNDTIAEGCCVGFILKIAKSYFVCTTHTRGIVNVRIHIERVIELLQRKRTILESTLPIDLLTSDPHEATEVQVPMIDRIIRVCSGLINLSSPIEW